MKEMKKYELKSGSGISNEMLVGRDDWMIGKIGIAKPLPHQLNGTTNMIPKKKKRKKKNKKTTTPK